MVESGLIPPAAAGAPWDIVFLDRDGTLNERVDGYVGDPDDLIMLPGAAAAVADLNRAGCRVVLVTNQRGLATGALSWRQWDAVTARLTTELAEVGAHLDRVEMCPHEKNSCRCRKPGPEMFEAALRAAPWARPTRCAMVGDMPSDIVPALSLGMRGLRIGEHVDSLAEAVERLLDGAAAGRR